MQFVELNQQGHAAHAGFAPHLDLQPIDEHRLALVKDVLQASWVNEGLEARALTHAVEKLVPEHTQEVAERRRKQADKQLAAVRERLVKAIQDWSSRAITLDVEVQAGKQPRMQPENARRRAEELSARLKQRTAELEAMGSVASGTPNVLGGALVIPQGLIEQRSGSSQCSADAVVRARIEAVAMQAVTDAEHARGHQTKDVSAERCGWDITAYVDQGDGSLPVERHIEVKGRAKGQRTLTVSRNEISYALNQKNKFLLAVVIVDEEGYDGPYYVREPFSQEPDWAEASKNLDLSALLSRAEPA